MSFQFQADRTTGLHDSASVLGKLKQDMIKTLFNPMPSQGAILSLYSKLTEIVRCAGDRTLR